MSDIHIDHNLRLTNGFVPLIKKDCHIQINWIHKFWLGRRLLYDIVLSLLLSMKSAHWILKYSASIGMWDIYFLMENIPVFCVAFFTLEAAVQDVFVQTYFSSELLH